MANSMGGSTGKGNPDFRGPQEKGKPAHATAHEQVGRGGPAGDSAKTPNRSGAVKRLQVKVKNPNGGGEHI